MYLHNSSVVYTKTWANSRDTAPLISVTKFKSTSAGSWVLVLSPHVAPRLNLKELQLFVWLKFIFYLFFSFSDAWRRRRRRRRGKMDENEMKSLDDHMQDLPKEAKRKIFAALFDDTDAPDKIEEPKDDIKQKQAF